ncbi:hypothetical protein I302_103094 [Kwoniella bestiolae CBS 10118]|uniref:glutathione transferase n=1 Tax=Kwoniella bestiolae CBS 10118 TaxID=1296100 RepID=A0A1B9GGZ0_9TREE|nr:hypothetical protein I302_01794 [Kwoniella bestiolae CBS 10118]OCF30275.1 hypothetical protein I302_01794 [Kwoniella bestiolae CBS 10118]
MVFVLYGNIMATHTRLVYICAQEMGLVGTPAFELRNVDWSEILYPKDGFDYDKSPFKRIPWFEDTENGVRLFESRAIVKYMAMKINSPPIPRYDDPVDVANFEVACSLELGDFTTYTKMLLYELVHGSMAHQKPTDEHLAKSYRETLTRNFEGYERILSKQRYLAGDKLSVVDLFHIPSALWLAMVGGIPALGEGTLPFTKSDGSDGTLPIPKSADRTWPLPQTADGTLPFPHLREWWNSLMELESVRKVNGQFIEIMQNMRGPHRAEGHGEEEAK